MISFDPSIWGLGVWKIIFLSFEQLEGELLFCYIKLICLNLPCAVCRDHIKKHFEINNNIFDRGETYLLVFFIELFNKFYPKSPINLKKVNLKPWIERDKKNKIIVNI